MAIETGEFLNLTFQGLWNEQRILFSQTFVVTENSLEGNTVENLEVVAEHYGDPANADLTADYLDLMSNTYTLQEVRAQIIAPIRSAYASSGPLSEVGTIDASNPTGNVAAVITLRTVNAGRDQVANKHIGPVPSNMYATGKPAEAYLTLLATLGLELTSLQTIPGPNPTQLKMVPIIYHKVLGTSDLVNSYSVSDRLGTMRRRTLRVGE